MHKVERNNGPNELKNLDKKLQNIDINTLNVSNEWTKFTRTKLKEETLSNLKDMYAGYCSYCEVDVESVAYGHIEHFRPKSIYPNLMFDYNNLHYVCPKCNQNKGYKFDEKMIDPSFDNPEEHIYFVGTEAKSYDERGAYMIEILKLNDPERLKRKTKLIIEFDNILVEIKNKYRNIKNMSKSELLDFRYEILKAIYNYKMHSKHGAEYCTMCKNYCDKILKVLKPLVLQVNKKISEYENK